MMGYLASAEFVDGVAMRNDDLLQSLVVNRCHLGNRRQRIYFFEISVPSFATAKKTGLN